MVSQIQESIEIYKVKIADFKTAEAPHLLVTNGLGSCIGLALYDENAKRAGLAHIMLPEGGEDIDSRFYPRYANTAIRIMLAELEAEGCRREGIIAKMAGGASMFQNTKKEGKGIGERNAESVAANLEKLGITLAAADTGGDYGRSIEFRVGTGEMHIRSIRHGTIII